MLIVKLIVLLIYFEILNVYCVKYCEICSNHTLCLYPNPGPNPFCKDYDNTAPLTRDNINNIVNRINERRNFVALGLSKFLPQAANMRKISWSSQLADMAQRWVDQCDQFFHPDKEDQCRDLENVSVGQNIATILGSTPGLNVKSFVDMWYIKSLDYTGSVTYYNQSKDGDAHYFTQLIWADTAFVGCGRAKFKITVRNITAERVVCNFAPKGNINGKPVYAIGYPTTQCSQRTETDNTFPGLCYYQNNEKAREFTPRRPVSSLLRILNLSNNSVKQEIDPIRSNLKQTNYGRNKTIDQRNQKTRHVLLNNTYSAAQRNPSIRAQKYWINPENRSRNNPEPFYQAERGHSRVYHGHQPFNENFDNLHKINNGENFGKYDFTTEPMSTVSNEDFRKYNIMHNQRCTRKMVVNKNDFTPSECTKNDCTTLRCTRSDYPQTTHSCQTTSTPVLIDTHSSPDLCPCNTQTTICPSSPSQCNCNLNCRCISTLPCATTRCPHHRRSEDQPIPHKPLKHVFHQYDLSPNLAPRSGNILDHKESSSYISRIFSTNVMEDPIKHTFRRRITQGDKHQKNSGGYRKLINTQEQDYNIYDILDPINRKKRDDIEQITFKPFWQVDQFSNKNPSELRSIRYTTLANRKNRKTRRTTTPIKSPIITEVITIKLKERGPTEKYLSFDELMHIRKLSTLDTELDGRRKGGETNILREDKNTTTSEVTVNTPFVRKKHCTRKLTCTWTAFTANGSDGNVGGDYGSRTPPGYVDGCTRTSTCTRDFQDRNKISTIPDPTSNVPSPEDEDYCEKRALNVQRRDINEKEIINIKNMDQSISKNNYATTPIFNFQYYNLYKTTPLLRVGCHYSQGKFRIKRDKICCCENTKSSYGDLNYITLNKIMKSWENNRH